MWFDIAAYGIFALLVIAVLPLAKVRHAAVTILHRGAELAVLAMLVAFAAFFHSPQRAPAPLAASLQPAAEWLDAGIGIEQSGLVWLLVGVGLVAVSLPALVLFDFSRRLASFGSPVRDPREASRRTSSGRGRGKRVTVGDAGAAHGSAVDDKPSPQPRPAANGVKKKGRTVLECLK